MPTQEFTTKALQALIDDLVQRQSTIPGGLLFVASANQCWSAASGFADPDAGIPMHTQDQFVADSISKMMTATLALQSVEQGALALDRTLGEYISGDVLDGLKDFDGNAFGATVTIRQLLAHRSGLADDWNSPGFLDLILADPQRRWRPEETIDFVKSHTKPAFSPGGGFLYSDPGYNLIGLAIETAGKLPLHLQMRERIFTPMGMEHTYRPSHESEIPSALKRGVSKRYLEEQEGTLLPAVITADWAGGGLVSTAVDLSRFLRGLVSGELFKSGNTLDLMLDWQPSSDFTDYGLGMARIDYVRRGHEGDTILKELWGHAGSSHNFSYYWPEGDLILVATLNQIVTDTNLYDTAARILRTIQQLAL